MSRILPVYIASAFWIARSRFSAMLAVLCVLICQGAEARADDQGKPNVLVIIIDDFDADLSSVSQDDSPVRTPNMERLARRGTWFTRAYNAAPTCCPARTALLTGVAPSRSGVYFNNQPYRRSSTFISRVETLPRHFLNHGYLTVGYGKITHNRFIEDDAEDYTPGYYKMFNIDVTNTDVDLAKAAIGKTLRKGIPAIKGFGVLPDDWDRNDPTKIQQDTEQANRTIEFLGQSHDKSFFIACGFWRPHSLWIVPQRYHDLHPLESIELPPGYLAGDLDDVPKAGRWLAVHRQEQKAIVKADLWKKSLQAYYAAVSYVDEQVGRVLDALEASPYNENTIVAFFGDNGYHLGEKDHWTKYALWEQTCRVPFAISVPGSAPQISNVPVGLLDLYPTLLTLCGLPAPTTHQLDGVDLTPLLKGQSEGRGAPVVSTYGRGNHSIRDDQFRYIRYQDGTEELYDERKDPHEWVNLAKDPAFAAVKQRLATSLPVENAPDIETVLGYDGKPEVTFPDEAFEK